MRSHGPSPAQGSASGSLDTAENMEENDVVSPLMEKTPPSAMSTWSADATDIFILLCSLLLNAASVTFIILVLHTQSTPDIPVKTLSVFQRLISSLSVTVTSAVMMVAGKRYVLFRLAREGLRSRRVAVYSNPSIGALANYLLFHGAELPLLGLSAVWMLGLATSLTVDNSWGFESVSGWANISVPFGPFNSAASGSSLIVPASEQLAFVMSSICLGLEQEVGLIKITNASAAAGHPSKTIYYPPLQHSPRNTGYSFSTTMNGFDFSIEHLSSVPSTARSPTCANSTFGFDKPDLWLDGSDNQSLSIVTTTYSATSSSRSIVRLNATAVIMSGTLSSFGNYSEFVPNGTSWPNVMSTDNQWAQDIANLICNTTLSPIGSCSGSTLLDFAITLDGQFHDIDLNTLPTHWSTALSMALGAYSSAMSPQIWNYNFIQTTKYAATYTPQYGIYVLMVHIVVSLIVLVIVVRLRLASHLNADFINSTRLLLDPLKKPELFNAPLETTLDTLEDPYMVVRDNSELVVTKGKEPRMRWNGRVAV